MIARIRFVYTGIVYSLQRRRPYAVQQLCVYSSAMINKKKRKEIKKRYRQGVVLDSQGPPDKVDARFGRRPAQFCKYVILYIILSYTRRRRRTFYNRQENIFRFFFFFWCKRDICDYY